FGTELEIVLKAYKADTVVLVGGLTDVCIHYTAVDAHQHDYRVRVVTDAVAGSTQRAHDNALEAVQYLQRDALVTAADVEASFSRV
ncbi:isochorismatase family protein, partial [Acinetobacter baumannii]